MSRPPFAQLGVWRQALRLAKAVYRATWRFPAEEKSGLTATLRRTAAGIGAKIADAAGRDDRAALTKALEDGRGSLREIVSYLTLAERLRFTNRFRTHRLRLKITRLDRRLRSLHDELVESEESAMEQPSGVKPRIKLRRAA